MADETKPPEDQGSPAVDNTELADLTSAQPDDEITKQLVESDKPVEQEPVKEEPTKEEPTEQEPAKEEPAKEEPQTASSEKESELQKQLKFYEELFGNQQQQHTTFQQPSNQQQQDNTQQQHQAQKNFLDAVTVSQDELVGLLSGEPERAMPVIKKFIATAIVLTRQSMMQEQQQQEVFGKYINTVQEAFYDKYKELNNYRPLVKFAGDAIQQEDAARGMRRLPHQMIDDIGRRALDLKKQMLGTNGTKSNQAPRKVVKQGEVVGTRTTPPPKEQLTEERKEMLDLLEQ